MTAVNLWKVEIFKFWKTNFVSTTKLIIRFILSLSMSVWREQMDSSKLDQFCVIPAYASLVQFMTVSNEMKTVVRLKHLVLLTKYAACELMFLCFYFLFLWSWYVSKLGIMEHLSWWDKRTFSSNKSDKYSQFCQSLAASSLYKYIFFYQVVEKQDTRLS